MNRSELFLRIARKSGVNRKSEVEEATKILLQAMIAALSGGKRIEVRGFGSFNLHTRKSRVSRNPKTGQRINVPPKRVIRFKPGSRLKVDVNR
ncbi:integration host factor subunit beta [Sulfurirhabdus autotrophica]|uniref:Integration host factor subunit beta n=2 Tax=Sulfurirhabdus autotrophica TaxID=1706046 RepID=A0A4R3XUX9_9PROT|nr:integration host factor subunit beta [Sulfurirhabdus autotrophica]